jgi:uncharacterized protein (TIRG00374 family)
LLKSRRFWIGLGISLIFLFLFFYRTDFSEMGKELGKANYLFLLPGILIYLVGVFFRSVRWQYLLKPLGSFSSLRLFPLVVIGFMVNNILPARLGIVARAYILGEKEHVSKMAAGGTMVVEQVFDGVTLLLFAAIISIFVPLEGMLQKAVYVAAGLFLGALVICLVLASSQRLAQRAIALLLHLLPKRWRGRVERWLILLIEGLGIMRSPGKLLVVLIISMLVWLCEAGMFYMVGFSFDLGQPFHVYLLAASISNLAWALLMTPGGLGSFDYFCQQTLTYFGVAGAIATSYVVVLHAVILLPMIALGFVFLWLENVSLAKITPQEKSAQDVEHAPGKRGEE